MKFNDLDIDNWKELDINVDSLWIIPERDKSGKHENIYHGNFIPQIPNQLIRRYTKQNEIVLDPFMGSGTTLFECEKLNRKFIGFDINEKILEYVNSKMGLTYSDYFIAKCDVVDKNQFQKHLNNAFEKIGGNKVQFVIFHPPYWDIIKFTNYEYDLSRARKLIDFKLAFLEAVKNALNFLEDERYFVVVIGDIYKSGEIIPLGFEIMNLIKMNFDVKLKGIVVKNIEGNRGKLGKGGIWRYRALKSDYFIFKHEYILVFKKGE